MARKSKYADIFTLRPDGRYQGYYRDENGKRHTVCNRDPEKLFFDIQDREIRKKKPKTFGDIASAWYAANWDALTPGTKASYTAHYNRAVDRLGKIEAAKIEPVDIQNHLDYLAAEGYTKSTINKQRTIYNLIFSNAIVRGLVDFRQSPSDPCKIPKRTKPAHKRTAPENDIVYAIQSSAETEKFGPFVLFLLATGFRRGEALGVRWMDVDMDAGYVYCRQSVTYHGGVVVADPKTDAGLRKVPILAPLIPYLQKPDDANETDYIFHGNDPSKPMPESTYKRRWLSYCKKMGFVEDTPGEEYTGNNGHTYTPHHYKPTLTAHVLRHGYATMLYEAEVDEESAKKFMGHSDIAITRKVYTDLRNAQEQKGRDKLLEYTKGGLSNQVERKKR